VLLVPPCTTHEVTGKKEAGGAVRAFAQSISNSLSKVLSESKLSDLSKKNFFLSTLLNTPQFLCPSKQGRNRGPESCRVWRGGGTSRTCMRRRAASARVATSPTSSAVGKVLEMVCQVALRRELEGCQHLTGIECYRLTMV
jgi:hypothetical protein